MELRLVLLGGAGQDHVAHVDGVSIAEGIREHLGNSGGDGILLGLVFLAPVGLEVDLPDLGDERIDGVGAGALVVEGVLAHLVKAGHELGLVDAVIVDAGGDVDGGLQVLGGLNEVVEALLVRLALHAAVFRDLHVALKGVGILVLGEGAHLGGGLLGVVLADLGEEQGIGGAVGDVVPAAQLVGQGVVHAQEGVGEGDAGQAGGVGHLDAGLHVLGAVFVSPGQVLEDVLDGRQGEAVGIVAGHDGDIGLHGVGQHVITGGPGNALGHVHHVVRVHDGHGGQQFIVRQRPLGAGVAVGDDGEGGDLGAGAGGGGDADQLGLLAHLGELVNALADIDEDGGQVQEVLLGMLIHQPHDLGGVDGGAAADGDDDIGLELVHGRQALHGVLDLGVHTDVIENTGGDAHVGQLVQDGLAHADLKEVGVRDHKGLLAVVFVLQLPEGDGGAALLEIDLLRHAQPQHILSPLCHGLDVQQLLHVGLTHEGAAAEGAGAQGQGRRRIKVVEVAQAAKGGGGVDEDAAGLHFQAEGVDLLPLVGVHVQRTAVAGAALTDELCAEGQGLIKVLGPVHAQHGAEFFVGPGVIMAGIVRLGNEDLGVGRDVHAGHLRQLYSGTAHGGGLDTVGGGIKEYLAHADGLLLIEEVATVVGKFLLHLVIDAVQHGDMLLGGADHAVIKGLGVDGGGDGVLDVAGVIEDDVAVAGAHADGRGAGGVGGLHHAGAAGGHDEVHFLHHHLGHLNGALVHPADDVLGQACLLGGLLHDAGGLDGAALGGGVGGDEDGVAGLEADKDLIDTGRSGVGGGGDGAHDAHGLSDALGAGGLVLGDDAAGLHVPEIVEDVLGSVVVLDDLVFHHAHARLRIGHFGQRDPGLVGRHGGLFADLVYLGLGERGVYGLCGAHFHKLCFQGFDRCDFVKFLCHSILLDVLLMIIRIVLASRLLHTIIIWDGSGKVNQ